MLVPKIGPVAVLMLAALCSSEVRAEAGVPACVRASFVEVFAGSPDCPGLRYAVIDVGYLSFVEAEYAYVMLGSDVDDGVIIPLDAWAMQDEEPQRLLIGTAEVEKYFGVQPDVVVDTLPLRPTSGWMEGCYYTEYGEEGSPRINTCDGQAIHWISNNNVELVDPSPTNSKGDVAEWIGCPAPSDGGTRIVDAADNLLCEQIIPEPPPVVGSDSKTDPDPDPTPDDDTTTSDEPVTDEASDDSADEPVTDEASDDSADDDPDTAGSGDDTSSSDAETDSSDDLEPSTEDDSDDATTEPAPVTGEQGDDELRDASASQNNDRPGAREAGSAQGEPVQHGIESKEASGCNCHVGQSHSRGAIWGTLLVGLFACYGFRRGLGRRAQGR